MDCINLKEHFGKRFRIRYEESYYVNRTRDTLVDPWLMVLLCRYGHVFPHGGNLLAASVDGHPKLASVLRQLPCCRVHQDGDDGELTMVFDVSDFAKVAAVMRPKRRRQLSEAQRAAAAERLARFSPRARTNAELTSAVCVQTV